MEEKNSQHISVTLRSEEVQEIIGHTPHWLIRWGTTVFFSILALIIVVSWIIHYPDLITAPFRLTMQNAPKSVTSKIDGKLIKLLVKNNTLVQQNQILGYLESTANHEQVLSLSSELGKIYKALDKKEPLNDYKLNSYNKLGELQSAYQTFNQDYIQFMAFQTRGYYQVRRQLLEKELRKLEEMDNNLREQKNIYQENWELALNDYNAQKKLAEEKVIAVLEFKKEESKMLEKKLPLKQAESAILNNSASIIQKRKEILELDKLISEQRGFFLQSLNTFRSTVESWENKYLLIAPITGRVFFSTILEEKQNLSVNQEVFFIGAENNNYYGEVHVPQQNLGKVKTGQDVIVKFDSYPFQEFGTIKGKVVFISELPDNEKNFLIKVELPNKLVTNYGEKINYKTGMNASAEIVTSDMRLLERIFFSLRKSLSR